MMCYTSVADLPIVIKPSGRANLARFKSIGVIREYFVDNTVYVFTKGHEDQQFEDFFRSVQFPCSVFACDRRGIHAADEAILTRRLPELPGTADLA